MVEAIQWLRLDKQFEEALDFMGISILELLNSGMYIGGPAVAEFEQSFAKYVGVCHAIGVSSGTDGLTACLAAAEECNREQGDDRKSLAIIPANTFVATANAALRIPEMMLAFVDCDEYFQMDIYEVQRMLEQSYSVYANVYVMPVHMYGMMGPVSLYRQLTDRYSNVHLIEDASHAQGSMTISGQKAGSFGVLAAYSLYPGKPLGAAGDAGVVVTDVTEYANVIRSFINCGRGANWEEYSRVGYTHRLDAIQALILKGKLCRLDEWRGRRIRVATAYFKQLRNTRDLVLPCAPVGMGECAWYGFPVRLPEEKRAGLQRFLWEHNIPVKRLYSQVVPDTDAYRNERRVVQSGKLTRARRFAGEVLCLPIHEHMDESQVSYVVDTVNSFLKREA